MAATSLVRCVARWGSSGRPRSPLRVLCIAALDTLHALRHSKGLSGSSQTAVAALLDLGANANALFDAKGFCRDEHRATRLLLRQTHSSRIVDEYLPRLRDLEQTRPAPGGDSRRHEATVRYRDAVVRLSLGTAVSIAFRYPSLDDGIVAVQTDAELVALLRVVTLSQVVDDVFDYEADQKMRLPSYLTAHRSVARGLELTRNVVGACSSLRDLRHSRIAFPFRAGHLLTAVIAKLSIAIAGHLYRREVVETAKS